MSDRLPAVNCTGDLSIFSDESDLASDIEADLQELPGDGDDFDSATFSLRSGSPFAGSFSSLVSSEISDDTLLSPSSTLKPSQQQQHCQNYLRSVSLKSVHTQILNAGRKTNCGSPSCIVRILFNLK